MLTPQGEVSVLARRRASQQVCKPRALVLCSSANRVTAGGKLRTQ